MYYRKEIDGLRAIAILPVIWAHAGLPFFTGGFLGVDVFFVISGFLITSILLKDFEADNFSLIKFYERRARRIIPALLIVIIVTSIFIHFISQHPKFIEDYGISILSTALFSSNFYFWQTSGYFGSVSELSPMLHTWSLAVEEQYYIFFPLLIMALFSSGKKVIVAALVLISIISLLIAEWGAVNSSIANFYLLPSRVWELMFGALAAIFYLQPNIVKIRNNFSMSFSSLGLVMVFLSYFLFTPSTLHPTSLTLIPVLGVVLILLFSKEGNIIHKFLSTKLLSFVGLISYSLYLWHQPILALMKNLYSIHLTLVQILLAISLTFILSYLTWRFIENPFRGKNKFNQNQIFKFSILAIILISALGLILKENLAIQKLISPVEMTRYEKTLKANNSHTKQVMYDEKCKFWSPEFNQKFTKRFEKCSKVHKKAIFILGGSHGMDLYNAISMNSNYPFIVSVSKGYCRAHRVSNNVKSNNKCQYEDFKAFSSLFSSNIKYVLYTQTPDRLFKDNNLDEAKEQNLSLDKINDVVMYLANIKSKSNLDVIMVGMLPPLIKSPINWNYKTPFDTQVNEIISNNSIHLTQLVDNIFVSELQKHEIPYISKFKGFFLNFPSDLMNNGNITYSDKRHLSYQGEKIFGERLNNYLVSLGYIEFSNKL